MNVLAWGSVRPGGGESLVYKGPIVGVLSGVLLFVHNQNPGMVSNLKKGKMAKHYKASLLNKPTMKLS